MYPKVHRGSADADAFRVENKPKRRRNEVAQEVSRIRCVSWLKNYIANALQKPESVLPRNC